MGCLVGVFAFAAFCSSIVSIFLMANSYGLLALRAGIVFVIFCVASIVIHTAGARACAARQLAAEQKKRLEEARKLHLNIQWFSPAPVACGEQVLVHISGTYSFERDDRVGVQYADAQYAWWSGVQPSNYWRHDYLFFDDHSSPATPFKEERHLHQYWYLYEGTGAQMAVFLHQPANVSYDQDPPPHLTITLSPLIDGDESIFRAHQAKQARRDEERRLRLRAEIELQQHVEAEAIEAKRRRRFRTIEARYSDELFAWRCDEAALKRYATDHRDELLSSSREQQIINDYSAFTNKDLDFTEWLKANHEELFGRTNEVFFYRVRAIAEALPKEEPPPVRPKLTPEERQAKFERYRQRGLEYDRVKAEDRMAAVRQNLELLQQFRADLQAYDIDEDERDRLVKEFEDQLFAQTEEDANGNFTQV